MNNDDMFIQNIYSKHKDRISVKRVFDDISKLASNGCGLYYEIYEGRLLSGLRNHLNQLKDSDADKLINYVAAQGYRLDDDSYRRSKLAEKECMVEIRKEQE
ncbi:dpoa decarboxylase [Salmonella enterica]|nr:dpoa decarboxylase [Salmonella enterica]EBY3151550.1 dpoa decarboxylase [Salmonella enterica subsp. enterica serovar Teshie]ECD6622033.1 dpoa decarboxylase [Salmonella enterica subsp. enterica]ECF3547459.1 dpoa decarboxylase [Salmonella enterica subsp. enterica]ECJ5185841.1 dpoa decarboxylase [Salmonella enterica subsp. enterica]